MSLLAVKRSDTTGAEQTRQLLKLTKMFRKFLSQHPTQGQDTTGDILVSEWGTTASGGSLPDDLQKWVIPVVNGARCRYDYPGELIADSMICAGLPDGGKDSC
ncbi:unnamed protein product [Orchesella dallaii]|uniref:Peptidase S1 domain-containing protein n=1 Tax=Orchesella dallaii TaxID=48710 RepID=A0ABP1R4S7_9HEXA